MSSDTYRVSFEIAGPAAMFTRPDTGAAPVSYPAPTYSAVKGMFEAVARFGPAYIRPVQVEICKPIQFHKYVTNYGGPLRKSNQLASGTSYQLVATILVDVCYRVHGLVEGCGEARDGVNQLHALKDIFERRLQKGQFFYAPCLGWKEFLPSYMGPFREGTQMEKSVNQVIPSMLHTVFDGPTDGTYKPHFRQNVVIKSGVLRYDQ